MKFRGIIKLSRGGGFSAALFLYKGVIFGNDADQRLGIM